MFVVRTAFWLAVVVAFIPVSRADLGQDQEPVSAVETIGLARTIVADIATFCSRNETACQTGAELASQMGAKAREGARIVYTVLDKQFGEEAGADAMAARPDESVTTGSVSR